LELGKIVPDTQRRFVQIAERIVSEEKVPAVVPGCTELPLFFDEIQMPVPNIDESSPKLCVKYLRVYVDNQAANSAVCSSVIRCSLSRMSDSSRL
jgi:aspartate/glutamate racemase